MRLAIRIPDKKEVIMSPDFEKGDEYICKDCEASVVAKCGEVYEWHFAHKSKLDCRLSQKSSSINSMSKFHRDFQDEFYKRGAEREKIFPENIADIFYNGRVFEIQHSPITIFEVKSRNSNYLKETKNNVIWILDGTTQNINNFPKDCLKVMVEGNTLTFHFKDLSFEEPFKSLSQAVDIITDFNMIKERLRKIEQENKVLETRNNIRKWLTPVRSFDSSGNSLVDVYTTFPNYYEVIKIYKNQPEFKSYIEKDLKGRLKEIERDLYFGFFNYYNQKYKEALQILLQHEKTVRIFPNGKFKDIAAEEVLRVDRNYFVRYLYSIVRNPTKPYHKEARGIIKYVVNL